MPGIRTLAQMTTQVRRRADMENTTFVTDGEIQQYILDSLGDAYDLIIESAGAEHFRLELDFSTVADQADYNLNDRLGVAPPYETNAVAKPIYKILGVDVTWNGKWKPIRPYKHWDRNALVDQTSWSGPGSIFYEVFSRMDPVDTYRVIRLIPTPTAVYSMRVHYIPSPYDLTGDGTGASDVTFNSYAGWDEYIVCDAAAKCLEKEESFDAADRLLMRREKAAERIRWHAQTMGEDGGGSVRDADLYDHERDWNGEF